MTVARKAGRLILHPPRTVQYNVGPPVTVPSFANPTTGQTYRTAPQQSLLVKGPTAEEQRKKIASEEQYSEIHALVRQRANNLGGPHKLANLANIVMDYGRGFDLRGDKQLTPGEFMEELEIKIPSLLNVASSDEILNACHNLPIAYILNFNKDAKNILYKIKQYLAEGSDIVNKGWDYYQTLSSPLTPEQRYKASRLIQMHLHNFYKFETACLLPTQYSTTPTTNSAAPASYTYPSAAVPQALYYGARP